jgi:hypothetical protein
MHVIPAIREAEIGRSQAEESLGKKHETLSEKQTKSKRTWGMAQGLQCLPSQWETLSSMSSTIKKKPLGFSCMIEFLPQIENT